MKLSSLFITIMLGCVGAFAEVRTFTSSAGTKLKGELVSVVGDTVTIKKEDGTPLTLKLTAFSRTDQAWLQTQVKAAPAGGADANGVKLKAATKKEPFTNSLGMRFVPVPDTSVLFCTTVTRKEDFATFIADSGKQELLSSEWAPADYKPVESLPAGNITWIAANEFCKWLSQKEGLPYRLPMDREWSIAVGIGDLEDANATPEALNHNIRVYPWGNVWPPPRGAGNYADESLLKHNKKGGSVPGEQIEGYDDGFWGYSPVTAFKPNRLGLHDMGGNVWQWCQDFYNEKKTTHPLRGAAWFSGDTSQPHSAARWPNTPSFSNSGTGFRCVVELPKP